MREVSRRKSNLIDVHRGNPHRLEILKNKEATLSLPELRRGVGD